MNRLKLRIVTGLASLFPARPSVNNHDVRGEVALALEQRTAASVKIDRSLYLFKVINFITAESSGNADLHGVMTVAIKYAPDISDQGRRNPGGLLLAELSIPDDGLVNHGLRRIKPHAIKRESFGLEPFGYFKRRPRAVIMEVNK